MWKRPCQTTVSFDKLRSWQPFWMHHDSIIIFSELFSIFMYAVFTQCTRALAQSSAMFRHLVPNLNIFSHLINQAHAHYCKTVGKVQGNQCKILTLYLGMGTMPEFWCGYLEKKKCVDIGVQLRIAPMHCASAPNMNTALLSNSGCGSLFRVGQGFGQDTLLQILSGLSPIKSIIRVIGKLMWQLWVTSSVYPLVLVSDLVHVVEEGGIRSKSKLPVLHPTDIED